MAGQQERARRTRATLVQAAAEEFSLRGFSGASIAAILETAGTTKGALYFHFPSKQDLALAVLERADERFGLIAGEWLDRHDADPLQVIHAMVMDIAAAGIDDAVFQAQVRLISEPEFSPAVRTGSTILWLDVFTQLIQPGVSQGIIRADVDIDRNVRGLLGSMIGNRFMLRAPHWYQDLPEAYNELMEIFVSIVADPEWLQKHQAAGWSDLGSVLNISRA